MRWPSRLWHSPATATGRVHLPSSPRICSGGAVANIDLRLNADAHTEVKLESGSGQSERGGNIVIVKVVEKVYLASPPGVGVGNWGWGWVVGLFHRTIHLLNRKSTNSEAKLVQAGSQASVLLLAEEKSPTPLEPWRWNSPRQMERSTATTTAGKPRGSIVKKANYVEPQTTTDKNESAVSVDYDALDDSPTGHLAKKQRTTPSPETPSTHHSLGRPLPQPAPVGEVRYYQDEYEEKNTSEIQKPNSSKSQDNTRGSAQRLQVRSPIALRMSPLPVPTTRPITRPNLKASLLYQLTPSASTTELAASLAYTRATVPVYPTNSNFGPPSRLRYRLDACVVLVCRPSSRFSYTKALSLASLMLCTNRLQALRSSKPCASSRQSVGPHSRCERCQLSRDLAAIRPSSSGLQGSAHHLRHSRNRRNFYQFWEAFRVMLATGAARRVQHVTRSAAPRRRCSTKPCLESAAC